MSRDFIGSSQGRSFLKSENRDRVTRAFIEPPGSYSVERQYFYDTTRLLQASTADELNDIIEGARFDLIDLPFNSSPEFINVYEWNPVTFESTLTAENAFHGGRSYYEII